MSTGFPSVWGSADFCDVVFNSLHSRNDFPPPPLTSHTFLSLDFIFSLSLNEHIPNFSHFHPYFLVLLFLSSRHSLASDS